MKELGVTFGPATRFVGQFALPWFVSIAVATGFAVPALSVPQLDEATAADSSFEGALPRFVILEKFGYPS